MRLNLTNRDAQASNESRLPKTTKSGRASIRARREGRILVERFTKQRVSRRDLLKASLAAGAIAAASPVVSPIGRAAPATPPRTAVPTGSFGSWTS